MIAHLEAARIDLVRKKNAIDLKISKHRKEVEEKEEKKKKLRSQGNQPKPQVSK